MADVTALDPSVEPGSAISAGKALMADESQLTSAELPEYAYGGGGAPSPLGIGSLTGSPAGLTGFPTNGETYAILSSGDVNTIGSVLTNEEEETTYEFEEHFPLLPLERGPAAEDWTVLRLNVNVPSGDDCLALDYRFLSEEYPEYVGSEFNDAFIAEVDTTSWMVEEEGEIVRPNDFAASPEGAPISVNGVGPTAMSPVESEGTYFDAATGLVTTKTPITPGAHSIYLSIFDASDQALDSAVFLDNLRFLNESAGTCKPPVGKELAIPPPPAPGSPPSSSPPSSPAPSNQFSLGPSVKFKNGGTKATLTVVVPGPGTVTASSPVKGAIASRVDALNASVSATHHGKKGHKKHKKKPLLLPASVHAGAAGPVTITVKLSGTGKALLAKKGKLTVPVTIGFTPDGGTAGTPKATTVTFKKRHHKKHHGGKKG
ncbi:MAG TPA: choice-of-anchor L domain-containing protein [Solirubrobacterales bacterium]|nr:choice-of-anchor L domain-containing protein [Solirubrobacterales bacterium]